jgi:hypothetical protein
LVEAKLQGQEPHADAPAIAVLSLLEALKQSVGATGKDTTAPSRRTNGRSRKRSSRTA